MKVCRSAPRLTDPMIEGFFSEELFSKIIHIIGIRANDFGFMIFKALESRLITVEEDNAVMGEEKGKLAAAVDKSKNNMMEELMQMMKSMNEPFTELLIV